MADLEIHQVVASNETFQNISVNYDIEGNVVFESPIIISGGFRMSPQAAIEFADQIVFWCEVIKMQASSFNEDSV